jgi:hypothetical protein
MVPPWSILLMSTIYLAKMNISRVEWLSCINDAYRTMPFVLPSLGAEFNGAPIRLAAQIKRKHLKSEIPTTECVLIGRLVWSLIPS